MKIIYTAIFVVTYSFSFAQAGGDPGSLFEIDKLIHSFQFDKALTLLNGREDAMSADILQRKGHCYSQMGDYPGSINAFENLVGLDSSNTYARYQLAQLYSRNKQFLEAFVSYEKLIVSDSLNSFYYKQYGIVASQANAPLVALTNLFKAIQLNSRDVEACSLIAEILLESDQFKLADSILTHTLTINSSPQLNLLLAKAKLGQRKYTEVIKTIEKLLVESDTLPAYARLMGISYFHLHEFEKVIPCMNFLLKNKLKGEWIYYYLGVSYQRLDNPDSAIVFLNKAIEEGISSNISQYYIQLATSYESTNDFKSAIKYYKAAYDNSKKDILLYHLGRNYDVYHKDKSAAIAYFKRYLDSDDTIKVAREYTRQRLNELEFYR